MSSIFTKVNYNSPKDIAINVKYSGIAADHKALGLNEKDALVLTRLIYKTKISYLDLQINDLSDCGVTALAVALQNDASLKRITLSYNSGKMGNAGLEALANALETNTTVVSMNLDSRLQENQYYILIKERTSRNLASYFTHYNLTHKQKLKQDEDRDKEIKYYLDKAERDLQIGDYQRQAGTCLQSGASIPIFNLAGFIQTYEQMKNKFSNNQKTQDNQISDNGSSSNYGNSGKATEKAQLKFK